MLFDDKEKEKLEKKRLALLGIQEAKQKTQEKFEDLFVEPNPADKFDDIKLQRFNLLPKEFKLAIESLTLSHNLPFEMSLPALLATANFATSPLCDVRMKMFEHDYVMPTSEWFLTLARSGAKKSTIFKAIGKPIAKFEEQEAIKEYDAINRYETALEIYNKQRDNILKNKSYSMDQMIDEIDALGGKPIPPIGSDYTVPDASLNGLIDTLNYVPFCRIASDEASDFFEGFAMKKENIKKTVAALSSLFSGAPIGRITGVKESRTKIYNRRFSMFFLTQPTSAGFLNNPYLRKQGFLNRLLITQVPQWDLPPMAGKKEEDSLKASALMQPYFDRVLQLLNTPKSFKENSNVQLNPKIYNFTEESKELVAAWGDDLLKQAKPGCKLEDWDMFVDRAVEHATRLASTFTVFSGKDQIDTDDVLLGIELYEFFLEQLINLDVGGPSDDRDGEDIQIGEQFLKWFSGTFNNDNKWGKKGELICPDEGLTMTEILHRSPNFWRQHIKGKRRTEIMKELCDRQQVKAILIKDMATRFVPVRNK